jgi:hypothetical protein
MPARTASTSHRHFKTLIALVLSMTGGTFFLFWLANLSPVIPLRARPNQAANWDRISVRTARPGDDRGFFHFRIDEQGHLFQTSAWKAGQASAGSPGVIHILLSSEGNSDRATTVQTTALSRAIADLCRQYGISENRIVVNRSEASGSLSASLVGN